MRVPLDYYRILCLPPQASPDQIDQAFRDRSAQQQFADFSEIAIQGRQSLLEEAHVCLSTPPRRAAYDRQFLGSDPGEPSLPPTQLEGVDSTAQPSLELEREQLPGALLILLELGEYEAVLRLSAALSQEGPAEATPRDDLIRNDGILSRALAYRHLGSEFCQQRHFDQAAQYLQEGLYLLQSTERFPTLIAEIRRQLDQLRPFRILELVALPLESEGDRQEGLQLLKSMLDCRGGIEGLRDDRSGLEVDGFLRFIQQIRTYLTAAEQQRLFEREAQRPSVGGEYLLIYTLLGLGFGEQQAACIHQALGLLERLGNDPKLSIERAVANLLLGRTEAALEAIALCPDRSVLHFIDRHSDDVTDRLPGLCRYSERWLREEVLPHFRDLTGSDVSLDAYFANPEVQAYLEALPSTPLQPITRPSVPPPSLSVATPTPPAAPSQEERTPLAALSDTTRVIGTAKRVSQRGGRRTRGRAAISGRRTRAQLPLRLLGGLGLLLLVAGLLLRSCGSAPQSKPKLVSPKLELVPTPVTPVTPTSAPSPTPAVTVARGELTSAKAQQILEQWLKAKASALGEQHDTAPLEEVLAGSILSRWKQRSALAKDNGEVYRYTHKVQVESIDPVATSPQEVLVRASVDEQQEVSINGTPQPGQTVNDQGLQVTYRFQREQGQWRIVDSQVQSP